MNEISRKDLDNTLLLLAISHIDNAYRSLYLGVLLALQGGIVSRSGEILSFLKTEIENAKKLAYMTVSLGYKENDEFVQKQKKFLDEYIIKRHSDKIALLERSLKSNLPIETLVNAGIEELIFSYIFKGI